MHEDLHECPSNGIAYLLRWVDNPFIGMRANAWINSRSSLTRLNNVRAHVDQALMPDKES